jgi:hypothetical protein
MGEFRADLTPRLVAMIRNSEVPSRAAKEYIAVLHDAAPP